MNMKKRAMSKQKKRKIGKIINKFIEFGNKKSVFWSIIISTIVLTLLAIILGIKDKNIIRFLGAIWIIESIYIWIYLETKKRYNFK